MIRNMLFHISVVLLIIGCGKYEDSIENPSPNNILVEVEAPQTNGWSTEEIAGTRSGITKTVKQKGEYDLNMKVSTLYYPAGYATDEAATRWANMEDNITFRVIAYKSATATEISTANYAGYGDYKLLGSSVQTTKSLIPYGNLYIHRLFIRQFKRHYHIYQQLYKCSRNKRAKFYDVCKSWSCN